MSVLYPPIQTTWKVSEITVADTPFTPAADIITTVVVLCDASGGPITTNLPSAPTSCFMIKKTDSSTNVVTVSAGAGTIDGSSTLLITMQYESYTIIKGSGSAWHII